LSVGGCVPSELWIGLETSLPAQNLRPPECRDKPSAPRLDTVDFFGARDGLDALDHVRGMGAVRHVDPTDLSQNERRVFLTRWIQLIFARRVRVSGVNGRFLSSARARQGRSFPFLWTRGPGFCFWKSRWFVGWAVQFTYHIVRGPVIGARVVDDPAPARFICRFGS